ncbi:hypothetical protein LUZ60_013482 [Juncus effusus]|nr:hypothetical protein LUZ60_013482 [Juncus effusus]
MAPDLPCDGDGDCMACKAVKPAETELLLCRMCATPWHVPCLSSPPESLASVAEWMCPDCSAPAEAAPPVAAAAGGGSSELIAAIRAIEADESLNERQKARRRQRLMGGGGEDGVDEAEEDDEDEGKGEKEKGKEKQRDVLDMLDQKFNCAFCMQLPERPVTTPCGHNFCLKCFQKWVSQGKLTCAKCRSTIPSKLASQPRINASLVAAIRMAKLAKNSNSSGSSNVYHFIRNENRPEKAFTTERAKKTGKANACSGQIFVTVPPDHFGPISAENDPRRNQGVLVGETWEDRMECRQWGAHFPHVAGIAGQSDYGAQSVALSGGYEDDEDHGEWFLYTGSGGRDLSGNKRTNKEQSFDQKFENANKALRLSCQKGYPVRVVRSHKEKRSSYAPEAGVRYDGIYRIEKCWRKVGIQGHKVCRYLFVRTDNEPAPWTSDEHGDRPRPLPNIKELKDATDVTERKEIASWDYDEKDERWKWMKPAPVSRKPVSTGNPEDNKRARKLARVAHNISVSHRLLKEFSCSICKKVMTQPLTTPCAHNFCKECLLGSYADKSFVRERTREGGRTLRAQKIVKKCPSCPTDISEFLQNPQVNRELNDLIETLKQKSEDEAKAAAEAEAEAELNMEETNEEGSDDVAEGDVADGDADVADEEAGDDGGEGENGDAVNCEKMEVEKVEEASRKRKTVDNDEGGRSNKKAKKSDGDMESQLNGSEVMKEAVANGKTENTEKANGKVVNSEKVNGGKAEPAKKRGRPKKAKADNQVSTVSGKHMDILHMIFLFLIGV